MFRKMVLIVAASLFIFGISKMSFAMMCGEHSGSQQLAEAHSEHEHSAAEAAKDTATKESVNAGNEICPVSGEKIVEETKATYEYEGKIYNFCCTMCIDEFKKDPEKYIKRIEQELQMESKESGHEEHDTGMMQGTGASDQGMHGGHHH